MHDGVAGPGALLRTAVQIPHGGYPYGYAPFVSESLAGSLGKVAPPDLKETYSLGPMTVPAALPDDPVAKFAFSPNLWPGTESGKQFEHAMRTYYQEANLLANNLLRVFAIALDVKEDFFVEKVCVVRPTTTVVAFSLTPVHPLCALVCVRACVAVHAPYECPASEQLPRACSGAAARTTAGRRALRLRKPDHTYAAPDGGGLASRRGWSASVFAG